MTITEMNAAAADLFNGFEKELSECVDLYQSDDDQIAQIYANKNKGDLTAFYDYWAGSASQSTINDVEAGRMVVIDV